MNVVVTIGREHGSGGRSIGKRLAEKLGVECYDTRFITEAARESGINEKVFEVYNERPVNSLLYSIAMTGSAIPRAAWNHAERPLHEQIFKAQFDMISELGKKPCIIVGRCADRVLDESVAKCRVFIRADMPDRIRRITETYQVSEKEAEKQIVQTDKDRASYYQYHTGQKWGNSRNYDLCINTSGLSEEDVVDFILAYIAKKFQ